MSYPDDRAFKDVVVFGVLAPAGIGVLAYVVVSGLLESITRLGEALEQLTPARPAESGDVGQEHRS